MNWEQIEGNWEQFKGKVRSKWGKLTDNDLEVIKGKRQELSGKLQKRYGFEKEAAEKEIAAFLKEAEKSASATSCCGSTDASRHSA